MRIYIHTYACTQAQMLAGELPLTVMCEPAHADEDLTNAEELKGSVAVAKQGAGKKAFFDKALRVQKAGAKALPAGRQDIEHAVLCSCGLRA